MKEINTEFVNFLTKDLPDNNDMIYKMQKHKKSLASHIISSEKGFDARQNTLILEHLFKKLMSNPEQIDEIKLDQIDDDKIRNSE